MRLMLLAVVALVLAATPSFVVADEPATSGAPVVAAPDPAAAAPAVAQPDAAAGGCPKSPNGACCGSCQEKAAQGQSVEKAEGGCPCQRARKAAEKRG